MGPSLAEWPTSSTVTMRTLNTNEEFFNLFGGSDEDSVDERDAYITLRSQVTPDPRYQAPIVVDYATDGPDGLQNQLDAAKESKKGQMIAYYIVYALSVMCHSFWLMQIATSDWD